MWNLSDLSKKFFLGLSIAGLFSVIGIVFHLKKLVIRKKWNADQFNIDNTIPVN